MLIYNCNRITLLSAKLACLKINFLEKNGDFRCYHLISIQFTIYSSMLVSWVYFRLWFFPVHVIWHLHWECYEDNICQNVNYSMLNMLFAFICGLFLLHLFWFFLMVQGLFRRVTSKTGFKNSVSLTNSENKP